MQILYFSATGNIKYLAEQLADNLNLTTDKVIAMEFTQPDELPKSDSLVIMFPIHAFDAPRNVKHFIRDMKAAENTKIALIASGAGRVKINFGTFIWIRKQLEKKGYSVILERILPMPPTIITTFKEEECRRVIASAKQEVAEIAEMVRTGTGELVDPGLTGKIMRHISAIEGIGARFLGLELHANKKCTSCGICVQNCPAGNIRFNKKMKPRFGFKCLMCMRCIYKCPEKAISPWISRFVPIKGGYDIERYTGNEGENL